MSDAGLVALARAVAATGYGFTTPTPATHARVNARPGNEWARDLRDVLGWSRLFRPEILPPALFELMREADILDRAGAGFRSRLRLSSLDGMLFWHSAYPTASADSVFFGPDTYRFARAIAAHGGGRARRVVDIGCGAGPGAILAARMHPDAEVIGVDINPAALRLTEVNAALAGIRVAAYASDLLTDVPGEFDLILSNPPYLVDPSARAYRHGGGPLGAGLSLRIVEAAVERLAPGGTLLLYTGAVIVDGRDPFREAALAIVARAGLAWDYAEIDVDVFGEELEIPAYGNADRIAVVVLAVTRAPRPGEPNQEAG